MNMFASRPTVLLSLVLALGLSVNAWSQSAESAASMNAAMIKLFGNVPGFTATASMRVLDNAGKELMSTPMEFAFLDGNLRTRMDVNKMKASELNPRAIAELNQLGLAERVSIMRQDRKVIYSIYPGQKAVLTVTFTNQASSKQGSVQKTPLGKETIDSHPCTKKKVVITSGKNEKIEATTWDASDLKDFPIQIQTTENGKTSIVRFAQVQLARPDAKLFEPPAGFTQYTNQAEFMRGIASKAVGGGPRK